MPAFGAFFSDFPNLTRFFTHTDGGMRHFRFKLAPFMINCDRRALAEELGQSVEKERDLMVLQKFLDKHQMGVDDLFFVVHLGAKQLSQQSDVPTSVREHWRQVTEECHDLWHNTQRTGKRLV